MLRVMDWSGSELGTYIFKNQQFQVNNMVLNNAANSLLSVVFLNDFNLEFESSRIHEQVKI